MLDDRIPPMLAYAGMPFDSPRHLFEIKWDGTRCLLFLKGKDLRLQNRRLEDITARYPELSRISRGIRARNAILDGELVVLAQGRPDFGKLQQRQQVASPLKIELLSRQLPVTYIAFDLLFLDDAQCFQAPLRERKGLLKRILRESPHLVESRYIGERGKSFFKEVVDQGLEGVMAKALDSPYLMGRRSRHWLKIKPRGRAVCYVVGYTPGKGGRAGAFGALAVAAVVEGAWVYRGLVGSGFSEADLETLPRRLEALRLDAPPIPVRERVPGITWVRPELRCEVTFQEATARTRFRAPAFKRLLS
jgi:bifunctional non-homologous end joining protein LigD